MDLASVQKSRFITRCRGRCTAVGLTKCVTFVCAGVVLIDFWKRNLQFEVWKLFDKKQSCDTMQNGYQFKFGAILDLRRMLLQLDDDCLLNWTKKAVNNGIDTQPSIKHMLIEGFVDKLKVHGDSVSTQTLEILTEVARVELQSQNKQNKQNKQSVNKPNAKCSKRSRRNRFKFNYNCHDEPNYVEKLHDDVLCYIGNFLSIEDLCLRMQFLNYHFFKITNNPQTCKVWELPQIWKGRRKNIGLWDDIKPVIEHLDNNMPQFNISSRLSMLKEVSLDLSGVGTLDLFNYFSQWPEKVKLCMLHVAVCDFVQYFDICFHVRISLHESE